MNSSAYLSGKKVLIVLRHENSLRIVQEYVAAHGGTCLLVALDPIEAPLKVAEALDAIRSGVAEVDMVVMGTKVFDMSKEGGSRLLELLLVLKSYGVAQKPICMTHLQSFLPETERALKELGMNLFWCEKDNLKRDNMTNLGPIMQKAMGSVD